MKTQLGVFGVLLGVSSLALANAPLLDEQEYYLGRSVSAHILSSNKYVEHEFNSYMTSMVQWMAGFSKRPSTFIGYRAVLVDSEYPTALSAPGGYIFLSRKMLEKIENEDQLAGVLAHELAHIVLRHGELAIVQKMEQENEAAQKKQRAKAASKKMKTGGATLKGLGGLLSTIGDTEAAQTLEDAGDQLAEGGEVLEENLNLYFDTVSSYVGTLISKGFSKDQEHQADALAVRLMASSGYDAGELALFLSKEKPSLEKIVGQWQSTHPLDSSRVARVQSLSKKWTYLGAKTQRTTRYQQLRTKVLGR